MPSASAVPDRRQTPDPAGQGHFPGRAGGRASMGIRCETGRSAALVNGQPVQGPWQAREAGGAGSLGSETEWVLEPSDRPNPARSPDSRGGQSAHLPTRPCYLPAPPCGCSLPKPSSRETLQAWGHPEPTLRGRAILPSLACPPFLAQSTLGLPITFHISQAGQFGRKQLWQRPGVCGRQHSVGANPSPQLRVGCALIFKSLEEDGQMDRHTVL